MSAPRVAPASSIGATPAPAAAETEFTKADITTTGEVRAFTIVAFAAPGVPVPFVAALVDCDGTSVRANLINVEPDPEHVTLGMKVRLATQVVGTDDRRHRSDRVRLRTPGRLSNGIGI